jgi:hypothetical protein
MSHYLEYMPLRWEKRPAFSYDSQVVDVQYLDVDPVWKVNFHGFIYNMLLAGAMFARAYQEPFLSEAEAARTIEFQRWRYRPTIHNRYFNGGLRPTMDDFEYVQRFPVYNFHADDESEKWKWRDGKYESIFGPFVNGLCKTL